MSRTKAEIYRIVADLAGAGAAVLVVSSELLELIGLCHRIVVMHRGPRSVAEFEHSEFDEAGPARRLLRTGAVSDGHG